MAISIKPKHTIYRNENTGPAAEQYFFVCVNV